MYEIIATDDFINTVMELSLKHMHVLTNSFISVRKIPNQEIEKNKSSFLQDLLDQIKNQELE